MHSTFHKDCHSVSVRLCQLFPKRCAQTHLTRNSFSLLTLIFHLFLSPSACFGDRIEFPRRWTGECRMCEKFVKSTLSCLLFFVFLFKSATSVCREWIPVMRTLFASIQLADTVAPVSRGTWVMAQSAKVSFNMCAPATLCYGCHKNILAILKKQTKETQ